MSWTLALAEAYDESKTYTAQIKVLNYFELGCVISDMIKIMHSRTRSRYA